VRVVTRVSYAQNDTIKYQQNGIRFTVFTASEAGFSRLQFTVEPIQYVNGDMAYSVQ